MAITTATSKFFDLADIQDLRDECVEAMNIYRDATPDADDESYEQWANDWTEDRIGALRVEGYSAETARQATILAWQMAYDA